MTKIQMICMAIKIMKNIDMLVIFLRNFSVMLSKVIFITAWTTAMKKTTKAMTIKVMIPKAIC